jgi:hypothetical protein
MRWSNALAQDLIQTPTSHFCSLVHCPISASQIVFGNFPCAVLPQDEATIRLHLGKFNRTMRSKEKHVKELTEDLAMKRLPWDPREFNGQSVGDYFFLVSTLALISHTKETGGDEHMSLRRSRSLLKFKLFVSMKLPQNGKPCFSTSRGTFFPLMVTSKFTRVLSGLTRTP